MEIISKLTFFAVGLAAYVLLVLIVRFYRRWVSYGARARLYQTAKFLPFTLFNYVVLSVYLASTGAALLHWLVRPLVGDRYLPATTWAPEVFIALTAIFVFAFWFVPDEPSELPPPPPRGRHLKSLPTGSDRYKGRTIRSYHDLEN